MRKSLLIVGAGLAALLLMAGCSKAEVCDTCNDNDDCEDGLFCSQFSDGSLRCLDSPLTTCLTKSHLTAP